MFRSGWFAAAVAWLTVLAVLTFTAPRYAVSLKWMTVLAVAGLLVLAICWRSGLSLIRAGAWLIVAFAITAAVAGQVSAARAAPWMFVEIDAQHLDRQTGKWVEAPQSNLNPNDRQDGVVWLVDSGGRQSLWIGMPAPDASSRLVVTFNKNDTVLSCGVGATPCQAASLERSTLSPGQVKQIVVDGTTSESGGAQLALHLQLLAKGHVTGLGQARYTIILSSNLDTPVQFFRDPHSFRIAASEPPGLSFLSASPDPPKAGLEVFRSAGIQVINVDVDASVLGTASRNATALMLAALGVVLADGAVQRRTRQKLGTPVPSEGDGEASPARPRPLRSTPIAIAIAIGFIFGAAAVRRASRRPPRRGP